MNLLKYYRTCLKSFVFIFRHKTWQETIVENAECEIILSNQNTYLTKDILTSKCLSDVVKNKQQSNVDALPVTNKQTNKHFVSRQA